MDDDTFKALREADLLDAAIVAQMDLTPDQFSSVSTILLALNWLKAVAKDEGIPIESIDRKFVIMRILNREINDTEVELAVKSLIKRSSGR